MLPKKQPLACYLVAAGRAAYTVILPNFPLIVNNLPSIVITNNVLTFTVLLPFSKTLKILVSFLALILLKSKIICSDCFVACTNLLFILSKLSLKGLLVSHIFPHILKSGLLNPLTSLGFINFTVSMLMVFLIMKKVTIN